MSNNSNYTNIEYSEEFLYLVYQLAQIQPRIKIEPFVDSDGVSKILIAAQSATSQIFYKLTANRDLFNTNQTLGILNFAKLLKYYEALNSRSSKEDDNGHNVNIYLNNTEENSDYPELLKLESSSNPENDYLTISLGDPSMDTFDTSWTDNFKSFDNLDPDDIYASIPFTEETLINLQKRNLLIGAGQIKITSNEDNSKVIYNSYKLFSGDSSTLKYDVPEDGYIKKKFSILIPCPLFSLIPKLNYKANIFKGSYLYLISDSPEFHLDLFILPKDEPNENSSDIATE